jgi:hypothetical protein
MPRDRNQGKGICRRGGPGGAGRGMGRKARSGVSGGVEEYCVCPKCGTKSIHHRGVPCYSAKCSQCGTQMVRE